LRVGILLNNVSPEEGGGYTFEHEIFSSILKHGDSSCHKFILLSWDQEYPQELNSVNHIDFVSLYRNLPERIRSKILRIIKATSQKIKYPNNKFLMESGYEKYVLSSLSENEIDIIWYPRPFTALTFEIPFIVNVWDLQHRIQPFFPEVVANGEWNRREKYCEKGLKRAAYIIVGTETGKSEVEKLYNILPERIKILPYPTPGFALEAEKKYFDVNTLSKFNIPEKYLFYPAQFWPHKNHVGLLHAIQLLRNKYDIFISVVLVGSNKGNLEHVNRIIYNLNLSGQVHCLGFVSLDDLISLYFNAFALTNLTFFGPDNLPPLEAFAIGCPVIASRVPGAEEQLGDAALYVDPADPEDIALAIKSIYESDELRNDLIKKGRNRANRFTGKNFFDGMLNILDEFEKLRILWGHNFI